MVRRFGANPGVVALQIANEVNLTVSQDSSDGAYEGAREALVQGVIAASDEARRLGHDGLEIGFNWAYRTDPASEESFWRSLRDRGGAEFVRSLDWIGLDAYPGTVFPPAESDLDGYRDGMVNAMSSMRCFAAIPGIPRVGAHEGGGERLAHLRRRARDAMQADVLRTMVGAVHDFRGTYNVTDYRWFNLRDGDSSSPQPFQHFGLLDSAYNEKPAFAVYEALVDRLHRQEPAEKRTEAAAETAPKVQERLNAESHREGPRPEPDQTSPLPIRRQTIPRPKAPLHEKGPRTKNQGGTTPEERKPDQAEKAAESLP